MYLALLLLHISTNSNGLLEKLKLGHSNFYLNTALTQILIEHSPKTDDRFEKIESISKMI